MNKRFITQAGLLLAIIITAMACQPNQEKAPEKTAGSADTTRPQNIKANETGYADVNGLKMYYEVYGKGEPIVLLHGSYMTIPLNWSGFIPLLAGNRKVIVAEMQGHGRTRDIAREFSYEGMADDVSGLLKHLKIDSADILGYSMGGGIAFQMAIRHPEQVRKLIVLSGSYKHDGWWPDVEAMYSTINADMFKGSPLEKQYDSLGNDPAHFPDFVKRVISIDLKPYDWSKEVKNIKAPIFMAIGDADGIRYEHALELFRAKGGGKMGDIHGLAQSRLAILPGTTHIGMMQRTDWLIPMINDFLDAKPGAAPPTF
ncbi:alpha/beta fold hydrolase [Chitinophaga polysaccharea]|uniref:alpha/beta fold hydrolase n=1 Tax=Chitinophaga polysaccharea TaxID=1293035 RepID=UPI001158573D|nr:alpha/beta hydrolase [Chitinophaga polysaccharea]